MTCDRSYCQHDFDSPYHPGVLGSVKYYAIGLPMINDRTTFSKIIKENINMRKTCSQYPLGTLVRTAVEQLHPWGSRIIFL